MVEPARGARLGVEARDGLLVDEQVRVDDLDRDRAAEHSLLGAVHAPHAADADELEITYEPPMVRPTSGSFATLLDAAAPHEGQKRSTSPWGVPH